MYREQYMVQSVLIGNSNKSQATAPTSKANEVDSDQNRLGDEQSKTQFSDALETAIADDRKESELTTQRLQDEENSERDDLQAENSDAQSSISERDSEEISDSDKDLLEQDISEANDEQNSPSILAQIAAAQKIDTEVTESQKSSLSNQEASVSGLSKADKSKDAKTDKMVNKESDSLLKLDDIQTSDADFSETLQKIDKDKSVLFVNSNLPDDNTVTQGGEHSGQRQISINSVNMQHTTSNTQAAAQAQNPLLQQPLDMQEKHASKLLGDRVLMMINQGKQEVHIRLDPAELGSMHIKLHIQHDQVQVAIHTQAAESRNLIEQHLPRLREQLAQQGVNLGETNVSQQHNTSQQNGNGQSENSGSGSAALLADDSSLSIMEDKTEWLASKMVLSNQVIDYYA